MGMIAVVETKPGEFCVVRWTGRSGLTAQAKTYCGDAHSIGTDGVLQIPDVIKCCSKCETAIEIFKGRMRP